MQTQAQQLELENWQLDSLAFTLERNAYVVSRNLAGLRAAAALPPIARESAAWTLRYEDAFMEPDGRGGLRSKPGVKRDLLARRDGFLRVNPLAVERFLVRNIVEEAGGRPWP